MSKSRTGAPRRVAAGLLAGALTVLGVGLAPPAGAVEEVTTDRLAGATRYGTAAAIAGQPDFDGATTAILASGENFPDALAASGLAGANSPAPIVLTESDNLTDETRVALSELGSLDDVIVVGGTAAVSDDVVTAVEDEGYTVTRLAGNDRYETAAAIAGDVNAGDIDGLSTALIASGEVFADALAGGPIASAAGLPILLVNADGVPAATEAALDGIEQVIILGGTARITDETEAELEGITGNDAVRVAGVDRFETAAMIAEDLGVGQLGWAPEEVHLASGLNFPDALAAGPLGGIRQAPLLLTASVPQATLDFLNAHSDTIRRLFAIGGTAAVSDEDLATAETEGAENTDDDALTGGDTQTSALEAPELQSVALADLKLEDLAATYVFTFDEELDEDVVNPELFKLYNADTRNPALGDVFNGGDEMEIDGETAIVVFNLTDYGVASATLAAVEEGAVEDEDGNGNPAQSVATAGVSNSSGAGLVSAEITDAEDGEVTFTYSSPQAAAGANLYELVARNGASVTATGATAAQGVYPGEVTTGADNEDPSTEVTVIFECNGDDLPAQYAGLGGDADDDPCEGAADGDPADLSDVNNWRRANVISPTSGRIQSADLAGGGSTDGPDLASVTFAAGNEDLEDNEVLFTFDEAIDSLLDPGATGDDFALVYSNCSATTVPGGANTLIGASNAATEDDSDFDAQDGDGWDDDVDFQGGCILTGDSVVDADDDDFNNRSVIVTFDTDTIDNDFLVAATVEGGTVSEAGDDNVANDNDELELFDDQPASLWDDGEVAGPQLVGVSVVLDTTFSGEFSAWTIFLEFDKDIDEDAGFGTGVITYYYEDAGQVESDNIDLADCEIDDDTLVVCEITDDGSSFADATVLAISDDLVEGADIVTLGEADEDIQFPNPEASIELVEIPEAPESE